MSSAIMPVVKSLYFCDDIVTDPIKNKLLIVGVFNAVRVPEGAGFPYALGKLCVFTQLTGGVGRVPSRLDVVRLSTGELIYSSGTKLVTFPGRRTTVTFFLRLQDFVFPAAGLYAIEFYCHDQFLDDRVLNVLESP